MGDYYLKPSFAAAGPPAADPTQFAHPQGSPALAAAEGFMGFSYKAICIILLGVVVVLVCVVIWLFLRESQKPAASERPPGPQSPPRPGYRTATTSAPPPSAAPTPATPTPAEAPSQPAHDEVIKTADDAELQKYISLGKAGTIATNTPETGKID